MTLSEKAKRAAEAICYGFKLHDEEKYDAAIEQFTIADEIWFAVDEETARTAAEGYVTALREKDGLEQSVDTMSELEHVDWSAVRDGFMQRAKALGIDRQYAHDCTEAWKQHKVGGDYWTPMLRAQQYVVQAAIDDTEYPRKKSDGKNGHGPEPALYLVSVESHDLHSGERWGQAKRIMTEYYEQILRMREE